jgi:hypothetical protein
MRILDSDAGGLWVRLGVGEVRFGVAELLHLALALEYDEALYIIRLQQSVPQATFT